VFDRAGSYASPADVVSGVQAALYVGAVVAILGAVVSLGIPARGRSRAAVALPARSVPGSN
jgi:hypothetical protein